MYTLIILTTRGLTFIIAVPTFKESFYFASFVIIEVEGKSYKLHLNLQYIYRFQLERIDESVQREPKK